MKLTKPKPIRTAPLKKTILVWNVPCQEWNSCNIDSKDHRKALTEGGFTHWRPTFPAP